MRQREVATDLTFLTGFLANLYSRLLLEDPDPSAKWCQSDIKLIYEDEDKNDLANLRPILLTSCVGMIYHQILADRIDCLFI
jgi:hypothetical protein